MCACINMFPSVCMYMHRFEFAHICAYIPSTSLHLQRNILNVDPLVHFIVCMVLQDVAGRLYQSICVCMSE